VCSDRNPFCNVRGASAQLRSARVGLVADLATHGAWYRGRRLVAFDGSTLNVPDEATNREAFGVPGASRGRAAFPQVRIASRGAPLQVFVSQLGGGTGHPQVVALEH